jgi:hypothetical protein
MVNAGISLHSDTAIVRKIIAQYRLSIKLANTDDKYRSDDMN